MRRRTKFAIGLGAGAFLGIVLGWPKSNGTAISLSQISYLFELGVDHPDCQAHLFPWVIKIFIATCFGGVIGLAVDKLQKLNRADHLPPN